MDFAGPASEFHVRLCRTLKSVGMDFPMSFLLVGVIINTLSLITSQPSFVLDARTIKDVQALHEEISLLCLFYDINVHFRFQSLKVVPNSILLDCQSLGLSRSILSKKNLAQKTLDDAQTLFNFLALVRHFKSEFGLAQLELLVADFDRKSLVYLPAHTIRRPGVGPRIGENPFRPGAANKRPISSGAWSEESEETLVDTRLSPLVDVSNTKAAQPKSTSASNSWFNPFKFKSKPNKPRTSKPTRMDLNDENCPPVLSDAPLRMRRKTRFGLPRF